MNSEIYFGEKKTLIVRIAWTYPPNGEFTFEKSTEVCSVGVRSDSDLQSVYSLNSFL